HERVSFAILEGRECPPWLLFRRRVKRHPSPGEFSKGLFNILAMIRNPGKRADTALLPFGREESNAGLGFRDAQFDPALFAVKGLVRDDRKAEFLGVKIQRALLVAHRNGHEFYLFNHSAATF